VLITHPACSGSDPHAPHFAAGIVRSQKQRSCSPAINLRTMQ
jgi:hypothetical protein